MKHGGKQPFMHLSEITQEVFGPYHIPSSLLQPGMNQSFIYPDSNSGPYYFSDSQKVKHHYDIVIEKNIEILP